MFLEQPRYAIVDLPIFSLWLPYADNNYYYFNFTHPSTFFFVAPTLFEAKGTFWLPGDPVLFGYLNRMDSPPSS